MAVYRTVGQKRPNRALIRTAAADPEAALAALVGPLASFAFAEPEEAAAAEKAEAAAARADPPPHAAAEPDDIDDADDPDDTDVFDLAGSGFGEVADDFAERHASMAEDGDPDAAERAFADVVALFIRTRPTGARWSDARAA